MASRCCGSQGTCACLIEGGDRVTVTGMGTSQDPFVISSDTDMEGVINPSFTVTIEGLGTEVSPHLISVSYTDTASVKDLPDWSDSAPTNGQVPKWNTGLGLWVPSAATTAPTGAVTHDNSLDGDGSVGTPLQVRERAGGLLDTTSTGLGISASGQEQMVIQYPDDVTRAAAGAPTSAAITQTLDDAGRLDYWNGSAWVPVKGEVGLDVDTEFLALSGPYAGGPVKILTKLLSTTSTAFGVIPVLTATDLLGYAGVLSVHVQPTGAVPFISTVVGAGTTVNGTIYALDGSGTLNTQSVTGLVTAYVY